jgi:hypothetical protein
MTQANVQTVSPTVDSIAQDIKSMVKGSWEEVEGGWEDFFPATRRLVRQKNGTALITYRFKTGEVVRVTVEQVE